MISPTGTRALCKWDLCLCGRQQRHFAYITGFVFSQMCGPLQDLSTSLHGQRRLNLPHMHKLLVVLKLSVPSNMLAHEKKKLASFGEMFSWIPQPRPKCCDGP